MDTLTWHKMTEEPADVHTPIWFIRGKNATSAIKTDTWHNVHASWRQSQFYAWTYPITPDF